MKLHALLNISNAEIITIVFEVLLPFSLRLINSRNGNSETPKIQ